VARLRYVASVEKPDGAGEMDGSGIAMGPRGATPPSHAALDLFLLSLLALYTELVVIRWLASEVRVFAYFKNLPLMASFLGLGLGCARGSAGRLARWFPALFDPRCERHRLPPPPGHAGRVVRWTRR
jgi:hypothetical protein